MADSGKSKKSAPKPQLLGRPGNNVKMGIVGMPNIGKSTLFNVLSGLGVPAENYPFCTVNPSTARVAVPDKRYDYLCKVFKPKSEVQAALSVTDIAGLVKGAAEGQGLGNAFLSHINAVDGIYHVVRAFKNKEIEHVEGDVNPVRDIEIISGELRSKDIEQMEKQIDGTKRLASSTKDKKLKDEFACYEKVLETLKQGKDVRNMVWSNKEAETINSLLLLTAKPVIFLVNVSLSNWKKGQNKWFEEIKKWIDENASGSVMLPFCAEFEGQVAEHKEPEAKKAFLKESKMKSRVTKIIHTGYSALQLIHFFTCGEDEVKCWTLRAGTKAKQAAGVIHTDFEKGFICAETMSFDDFKEYGSEAECKAHGKYRKEGKDYVTVDGDIYLFRFNTGGGKAKKK